MDSILWNLYTYASIGLVGLIWTIQMVHYPSFRFVDEKQWERFHGLHTFSISIIVMPPMLVEMVLSLYFAFFHPGWITYTCLAIVIAIWINTFFQAVPLHNKLQKKMDISIIKKLVQVNWIRTFLWSIKAVLVLVGL